MLIHTSTYLFEEISIARCQGIRFLKCGTSSNLTLAIEENPLHCAASDENYLSVPIPQRMGWKNVIL